MRHALDYWRQLGLPIPVRTLTNIFEATIKHLRARHNYWATQASQGETITCQRSHLRVLAFLREQGAVVENAWEAHLLEHVNEGESDITWQTFLSEDHWLIAIRSDLTAVEELLEHGADIDKRSSRRTYPPWGPPLLITLSLGETDIASFLLNSGANVNAVDESGRTPLKVAAGKGYFQLVLDLLRAGADINATDIHGVTPLISAACWGRLEIVCLLIENNRDLPRLRVQCKRAARFARNIGHSAIANFLINHAQKIADELGVGNDDAFDRMCICAYKDRGCGSSAAVREFPLSQSFPGPRPPEEDF